MITALDTSVLLDVFLPDEEFVDASRRAVRHAYADGALVVCEPVFAELAAHFENRTQLDSILDQLHVRVEPVTRDAAFVAGRMFRSYRDTGGSRERMITDFLIGGHATLRATRLLTRDRGFYREYFRDLKVLHPGRG